MWEAARGYALARYGRPEDWTHCFHGRRIGAQTPLGSAPIPYLVALAMAAQGFASA